MSTTLETEEQEQQVEEKRARRLLWLLFGALAVAVVFLVILLWWLLRPEPAPGGPGVVPGKDGYPIRVVKLIYGYGKGPGEVLGKPLGAAFDESGNVWVSDTTNSRVIVFDSSGRKIRIVGTDEGPGRVESPYGIAIKGTRAYVADWTGRSVLVFSTTSGRYLERLPAAEQDPKAFGANGFSPYDVRLIGDRVVVASNDGLYFFDRDGKVAKRWGGKDGRGQAPGSFNFPDAFDVDPVSGRIYVADTLNRRVVALDKDGRVLWVAGRPDLAGKIKGFWQLPRGLVVGPDRNVYVVDTFRADQDGVGTGHLVVLSPEGELLSEFGRAGGESDSFRFPEKMAVGPDGLFALADRENGRVVLFRLEGMPTPDKLESDTYKASFDRPKGATAAS